MPGTDWQCYTVVVSHSVCLSSYRMCLLPHRQDTATSTVPARCCCGLWGVSAYPEAQSIPGSSKPRILELMTVLCF